MKKLVLPIAMAFMMSPMLNASSSSKNIAFEAESSCFDQAEAGFQAAQGSHEDKFKVFEAVYDECMGN